MPQPHPRTRPRHQKRQVLFGGGFLAPARAHIRITAGLLASLLVAVGLTLGAVVAPASADALISLSATSTGTILAGEDATVTLTASGPSGSTADYYNLAFRYALPTGVTYVADSAKSATVPALPNPTIVVITDSAGPPAVTHQVLIWTNIADLPHGTTPGFSFGIKPDANVYPVGAPIPGTAAVYAQTNPRLLAKFDKDTGIVVAGSFAASDTVSPQATKVAAIKVTKSEPSPEHELMRGVHNEGTVYTIATRNTGIAPTTGVVLVDYLPAGLEFLGCGATDNSAAEEYPGSGPVRATLTGGEVATCETPVSIDTVNDRPGFAGQVFTKVTWNLGALAAGSTRTITYAAGIPLRANTLAWPAGAPAAASLLQGANLDNNTGASTRQEDAAAGGQSLTNTATASGTYTGKVATPADAATSSSDSVTVKAMDLSIVKSGTSVFTAGDTADFSLLVRAGEYTDDSAMTIVDTIPNGLCPILPAAVLFTRSAGCPGDGIVTNATVTGAVANSDGTFTVTMTPAPNAIAHDGSVIITYSAYMNATYQGTTSTGTGAGVPTAAGDSFLNTVTIAGTTTGLTPGDRAIKAVTDDSSAGLGSDGPEISKKVLERPTPGATPVACEAAPGNYVDAPQTPAYQVGDKVCFELTVTFSTSTKTRNAQITDFVPVGTRYDSFVLAPGSTVAVTPVAGTQSATPLVADPLPAAWNLGSSEGGADLFVPKGAKLTLYVSAVIVSRSDSAGVDITANLMKYRQETTDGGVLALRDQVDYLVAPTPAVLLAKSIATVNGTAPAAPNDNVVVKEGDVVSYSVDVSGAPSNLFDVEDVVVWDALPAGYDCATWTVTGITAGGVCRNPGDGGYPANSAAPAGRSVILWTIAGPLSASAVATLAYSVTMPVGLSVSRIFVNTASVVAFTAPTTNATDNAYFPKGSLNPAHDTDGNAAPANDNAQVRLADAVTGKTGISRINETGNTAGQAVAGELVDYTFSVMVPAHTTVFNGVLSDALPAGLTTTGATATATLDGGALPVGFGLDTTTGALTFPATYDNTTAADQVFIVTLPGVLVDVTLASGTLTNTATFASKVTLGGTAVTPRTTSVSIAVVTPLPTLAKVVDKPTAQGGDTVVFTLTAGNTAGRPAAYDSVVTDCLPAGLIFGSFLTAPVGTVTSSAAGTGVAGNGCAVGTTRLAWVLPGTGALLNPATTQLTYSAQVDPASAGLVSYTNTASVTGSTLSANAANNAAVERIVTAGASAVVTVEGATTVKTVAPATATIGGTVGYTVKVVLPKNVNFYNATIVDTLPAGLTADASTATVTCQTATLADCATDLPNSPTFTLAPSGQKIGWLLGTVTSKPLNRTVTVTFTGTVTSAVANIAGKVLTNTAVLAWNDSAKAAPATAASPFDRTGTLGTVDITVIEPKLSITKGVSNTTPEPGQTFTYTVTARNANTATTSTAFAVSIVDTIPTGIDLSSITNISGGGVLSGNTITWSVASIAKNASAVLTYDAKLAASTTLGTGALVNTVRIPTYSSLTTGGRDYTANPPTATASVTPDFPFITLAKTVSAGTTAYLNTPFGWTLTLRNTGSGTAATVTPTDVLPANWIYVAGTGTASINGAAAAPLADPAVTTAGGVQTLVWPAFTTVAPGNSIVIRYSAQPTAAATTTPGAGSLTAHTNTLSASTTDATGATGRGGPTPYTATPVTAAAHLDSADLRLVKTAGSALVAGTTTADAWTITVSNLGTDTAVGNVGGHNFRVTDTPAQPLPAGLVVSLASGTGWSCSVPDSGTGAFTCDRTNAGETLASGSAWPAITVAVRVAADVASGSTVTNSATVAGLTFDPATGNNTDTSAIRVTTSADLRIVKAAQGVFAAGEVATWTIDVTNDGPSLSVAPLTVTDTLPGNISGVTATGAGWTCDTSVTPVSCTTATDLALGATSRITVTALVDADFTGSLTNSATVTGTTPDPKPSNNTSGPTTPVGTGTSLAIEKTLVGAKLVPGTEATYRFLVTNTGLANARNVHITDALPNGLTFVRQSAAGPGTWTCTETATAPSTIGCTLAGTLAPGVSAAQTVDVTVLVPSSLTGDVVNAATVSADNAPSVTDDTSTALTGESDLGIVKSHPAGPVTAGTEVSYTLSVTNHGPSDAPVGTVVTDHVPAGLIAQSADGGAEWSCDLPVGQDLTCTSTGILAAGDTASAITVVVAIPAGAGPATLTNVADVAGVLPEPATDPNPNSASDPTDVTDLADVTIVKSITPDAATVVAGGSIVYTLTVTNAGPSDADALSVTDTLPAGFTATAIEGADWTCTLATVSCTRATLGVTTSVITVTATVSPAVLDGTVATNTADVAWTDGRPGPHTDTDSVSVTVTAVADLVLVKTAPITTPNAGDAVDFDLALTNAGLSDAVGPITIVDTLPVGIRFQANTPGWTCVGDAVPADAEQPVTCTLGDGSVGLPAGGTATALRITTSTDPALGLVTLTNTATAATPTSESDRDNNTDPALVTFVRSADLRIVKSHVGAGAIGATTAFSLVVTNAGPSTAVGVSVVDSLPKGLTYVDATGSDPAWTCAAADPDAATGVTQVTCNLAGDLGATATAPALSVNALVGAGAYPAVDNVAVVSSATPDPKPEDNTATDPLAVTPLVTLAVTKKHLGQARVGGTLDYLISVSNVGVTADPGGFTIVDRLPAGLAFASSAGEDVTCATAGSTVTCTFDGPLVIGATRTVTLTISVLAVAFPQVVNTVTVQSLYQDPAAVILPGSDTAVVLKALAHTGVDLQVGLLIAFAILVLLLGAMLLLVARKRRGIRRG
ncbi:putative repeat protein (TIGR01451 family)/fimbrial isopeptide formation D2 family protein [Cryobacterium sp. MP_M5]|uniref:beta strand repeat-containing protein n=1 Tax=unclassified Cryobacterium TaxID=2649013 RepID=UPI0018CBCEBF|nr:MULTISPECIES: isopeptide-forming domain-containing fimbrial protein [unclassified Cryobacterium]MBG6056658.1 putative repeat protein (TIGR01451 family)/fimbrial isopeptide formation D2 family protein [Cryobacterium sp. MP_M3]MEC5176330.1 putative repeat protein (TIGR01451 family)/fimbrial isopeptide formation D2 family protein [Cryobacterium sp. MP_M5]